MSPKTRARALVATGLLTLLLGAGLAAFLLWPKPPPPSPAPKPGDTGYTRVETEQRMRDIGYVQ